MVLKRSKWHTALFLVLLLIFTSLSLYEIYRSSISTGTIQEDDDVLVKRRDEFYEGLDKSGIETHQARYWEEYEEETRINGE